jgi:parvulin-like peptidyl-prolyl isomerase
MDKSIVKILLSIGLLYNFAYAGIVDAIAIKVGSEIITLLDIEKMKEENNFNNKKAIQSLITKILQEQEAKKRGISIRQSDVNAQIAKIAMQNKITKMELYKQVLDAQGLNANSFKNTIKVQLLQQKLFQNIMYDMGSSMDEEELKEYYNLHINDLSYSKEYSVIEYISPNAKALQNVLSNPLMKQSSVKQQNNVYEHNKIAPKVETILNSLKAGEFSQIIPLQGSFILFYMQSRSHKLLPDYTEIKEQIKKKLFDEQRTNILGNYFQDIQSKTKIEILRRPNE